jgi:muconolactone delta-isomerase
VFEAATRESDGGEAAHHGAMVEAPDDKEISRMEFLVTMTTQVPAETDASTVDSVRARETARSLELAAGGQLLRLWRPPLAPGEWRTFGLFAADSPDELEVTLASMPLRIWRQDEVTPLLPHPNDPPSPPARDGTSEFFTEFTVMIPDGADPQLVADARRGEADATRRYAEEGTLVRLWALDEQHALGLWQTNDDSRLQKILAELPLAQWLTVDTVPLKSHPSDPAHGSRAEP